MRGNRNVMLVDFMKKKKKKDFVDICCVSLYCIFARHLIRAFV
jgi:hypothetical protein